MDRSSRDLNWLRRLPGILLATVLGLAAAGLCVELLVRVFMPQPINPRFVVATDYGIRDNQPRAAYHHSSPREYAVSVTTNSDGLRGSRDFSPTKPQDSCRIALLGDSFVFGYGVSDDDVVSAVLRRHLNARSDRTGLRYQVLNFAVSGFGQGEQLIQYRNKVNRYEPDHVVLFYFENDIGNNVVSDLFSLAEDKEIERTGLEYLPAMNLRQPLYRLPPFPWLISHSQGWSYLRNTLSSLLHRRLLSGKGLESYRAASHDRGIGLTRALLLNLISEVEADDAQPYVFAIPNREGGTNFPLDANEIAATGATLIDGRTIVNGEDYYPDDGHWTPSGHAKAAKAIGDALHSGCAGMGKDQ